MADNKRFENPVIQARLPVELDEKLTRVADMFGLPKNDIARFAIAQFCGSILGTMDKVEKGMGSYADMMDRAIQKGLSMPDGREG